MKGKKRKTRRVTLETGTVCSTYSGDGLVTWFYLSSRPERSSGVSFSSSGVSFSSSSSTIFRSKRNFSHQSQRKINALQEGFTAPPPPLFYILELRGTLFRDFFLFLFFVFVFIVFYDPHNGKMPIKDSPLTCKGSANREAQASL